MNAQLERRIVYWYNQALRWCPAKTGLALRARVDAPHRQAGTGYRRRAQGPGLGRLPEMLIAEMGERLDLVQLLEAAPSMEQLSAADFAIYGVQAQSHGRRPGLR